ncbi:DNA adenine methylase [Halomicrobium zhouii]|uniref:site-specific DNA-methyltransferase (adenine-specific) n=1 Tax=Halomicrobium zhouii TaxID=767519 RepID=A0A1I6K953_9EURY|nr:DNA adenine methylase [Halomicrobium zhouii]SFR87736.1 DNA adenine methylase [Halomicrobium zhouii]
MPKPILKWAGGKRQILAQIRGHFPPEEDINSYHEPFFGGGAIFFRETHKDTASINDVNTRLMNFYEIVRERPGELIEILSGFDHPESEPDTSRPYSKQSESGDKIDNYYYQQRELFNRRPRDLAFDEVEEAALLLYLNRTCFNGLYRENQSGEFNVPCGSYTNPDWVQESRIKKASKALKGVEIYNEDFSYIIDQAKEGDLVYCDPPYDPNGEASTFSEYSSGAFGKEEQERLRDVALKLNDKGVNVVISNAPSVGEIYQAFNEDGFRVSRVGAKRSINSDGESRGEVKEVIITNAIEMRERDTHLTEYTF